MEAELWVAVVVVAIGVKVAAEMFAATVAGVEFDVVALAVAVEVKFGVAMCCSSIPVLLLDRRRL